MSTKSLVSSPPKGLMRWFLRAPIFLYQIGLGWLLGERFVLLHHIGRKSGQARQTVVEIIGHEQASDTYYIASGWGHKAQWYQNILATPIISIQVGRRKLKVLAKNLSPEEGAKILVSYREKHPFAARELSSFMGVDIRNSSLSELENIVQDAIPIFVLHPHS
jgi:deazaflavin-dependent oxidoreductase (nitroreductase family)